METTDPRRMPSVGEAVIYCDPRGKDHNALVQCVWGPVCVNVLYLSDDETRKDNYGRQSLHETSVSHVSNPGTVHGRYWRFIDEERIEYTPPAAV